MNCYACGQPALPTLSQHLRTCAAHRDALVVDKPKMRVHWLKKPGCPVCGKEKYMKSGYCKTHRDEKAREQTERRKEGRRMERDAPCSMCGKVAAFGNQPYCRPCRSKRDRARYQAKKEKGAQGK